MASEYSPLELVILGIPSDRRGFDEDQPWASHPRTGQVLEERPHLITSSILLGMVETLGCAAMQQLDMDDKRDRDRLREVVREADLALSVLKVGLNAHDEED